MASDEESDEDGSSDEGDESSDDKRTKITSSMIKNWTKQMQVSFFLGVCVGFFLFVWVFFLIVSALFVCFLFFCFCFVLLFFVSAVFVLFHVYFIVSVFV